MNRILRSAAWLVALSVVIGTEDTIGTARAGAIISPIDAVVNVGGEDPSLCCGIVNTINHSGLSIDFISGVTDFAAYIGLNPQHTLLAIGFEWFAEAGTAAALITYDLGANVVIDQLALWNEEVIGISRFNVDVSVNGSIFVRIATGLVPTDNPLELNYSADVFAIGPVSARFVQLNLSCSVDVFGCSMGEIAFSLASEVIATPEPVTLALFGLGLAGLYGLARRRKA